MPCFYLTPNKTTSTKFLNSKSASPKLVAGAEECRMDVEVYGADGCQEWYRDAACTVYESKAGSRTTDTRIFSSFIRLQLFDLETNYQDARCAICLTLQDCA